jgi:protein-S-isoprenylcysteine O-methyltransferase Ste14
VCPTGARHDRRSTLPTAVVYLVAFLLGVALQAWLPLPFLPRPLAWGIGGALTAAEVVLMATAASTLLRGHGTLNTTAPSHALVTAGPYRVSRNPLYLALVLLYRGLACLLGVVWALPLLLPLVVYTQVGVIAREERYLERAFGDAYRSYRSRVRRWL